MSNKRKIIKVKFDGYEEVSEFDSRVEDIIPLIQALHFLRQEAKKIGDKKLYDLISSSFTMVILAYDIALGRKSKD